jgi:hypothetical protein
MHCNMKYILIIILFFKSVSGFCQLSDNSLEKRFTKECQKNILSSECTYLRKMREASVPLYETRELFNGCFSGVHIYFVTFKDQEHGEHERDFYPALYAIDSSTGKFVSFSSDADFFNFVNKAHVPIANLDKAYLYLCLYLSVFKNLPFDINAPYDYPFELRRNSIFASDSNFNVFFYTPGGFIRIWNLNNTSIRKLEVYSKSYATWYRHEFSFDEYNNLVGVITDTER